MKQNIIANSNNCTQPAKPYSVSSLDTPSTLVSSRKLERDIASQVGSYDVLCYRHTIAFHNIGNKRFRVLCELNIPRYVAARKKREKSAVFNAIVNTVHDCGGKFLTKKSRQSEWEQVSDLQAKEKVGHTLRAAVLAMEDCSPASRTIYDAIGQPDEHIRIRRKSLAMTKLPVFPNMSGSTSLSLLGDVSMRQVVSNAVLFGQIVNLAGKDTPLNSNKLTISIEDTPVTKKHKRRNPPKSPTSALDFNTESITQNATTTSKSINIMSPPLKPEEHLPTKRKSNDALRQNLQELVKTPDSNVVTQPGPHDVLCDRNPAAFRHVGNRRFRRICENCVPQYQKAETKGAKSKTFKSIITIVHESGGKFLTKKSKSGSWEEMSSMRRTKEKVGHALRAAIQHLSTQDSEEDSSSSRASYNEILDEDWEDVVRFEEEMFVSAAEALPTKASLCTSAGTSSLSLLDTFASTFRDDAVIPESKVVEEQDIDQEQDDLMQELYFTPMDCEAEKTSVQWLQARVDGTRLKAILDDLDQHISGEADESTPWFIHDFPDGAGTPEDRLCQPADDILYSAV